MLIVMAEGSGQTDSQTGHGAGKVGAGSCKKTVVLSDWTGISPMRHFGGVAGGGMEFKQRKSHVILRCWQLTYMARM